jgi:hypothetical protein
MIATLPIYFSAIEQMVSYRGAATRLLLASNATDKGVAFDDEEGD